MLTSPGFFLKETNLLLLHARLIIYSKDTVANVLYMFIIIIPSREILEFPKVMNFDIITIENINLHFHFLP